MIIEVQLLGLAEFYFLSSASNVHDWWFKLLDNLQSIEKYN